MALTALEIDICNQALDRIAAGQITLTSQSDVKGIACNLHYAKTRDTLLRSYEFSFSTDRAELEKIKTLTLDKAPSSSVWLVGDTITGIASGTTAKILSAGSSGVVYTIAFLSGDFTLGETITSADVETVEYNNVVVDYGDEIVYLYDETNSNHVVCGSEYPTVVDSVPAFEYDFQYQFPDDYFRLLSVFEDDGYDDADDRYTIEGKRLLTNYETAHIKYIKAVTDPSLFDDLFEQMLVLSLAIKLIPPLCGTNLELIPELKQEFKQLSSQAVCIDENEKNTSGESNWNNARLT